MANIGTITFINFVCLAALSFLMLQGTSAHAEVLVTKTGKIACSPHSGNSQLKEITITDLAGNTFKLKKSSTIKHGRILYSFDLVGEQSHFHIYDSQSDAESGDCQRAKEIGLTKSLISIEAFTADQDGNGHNELYLPIVERNCSTGDYQQLLIIVSQHKANFRKLELKEE